MRKRRGQAAINIKPQSVAELSNVFEIPDIAEMLGIPQRQVEELLDRAGKPREHWEVTCNRTGRKWQTRSQRSAYRLVCTIGLTDWDWKQV